MVKTTGQLLGMKSRLKLIALLPCYTDEQREECRKIVAGRHVSITASRADRHYLRLYVVITGKYLDDSRHDQFKVLAQQFGDTAVQEAVEYILMKNSDTWPVEAFFSYLLKMLQGRRDKESITLDEESAEYTARREKTISKLHQARQWRK